MFYFKIMILSSPVLYAPNTPGNLLRIGPNAIILFGKLYLYLTDIFECLIYQIKLHIELMLSLIGQPIIKLIFIEPSTTKMIILCGHTFQGKQSIQYTDSVM